jgi:hypothetical protein
MRILTLYKQIVSNLVTYMDIGKGCGLNYCQPRHAWWLLCHIHSACYRRTWVIDSSTGSFVVTNKNTKKWRKIARKYKLTYQETQAAAIFEVTYQIKYKGVGEDGFLCHSISNMHFIEHANILHVYPSRRLSVLHHAERFNCTTSTKYQQPPRIPIQSHLSSIMLAFLRVNQAICSGSATSSELVVAHSTRTQRSIAQGLK